MSMNTLGGVLDQIQSQARQVSDISALNPFNATRKTESSSQFSNILLNSINNISGMQTFAKQQSQAYLTGAFASPVAAAAETGDAGAARVTGCDLIVHVFLSEG